MKRIMLLIKFLLTAATATLAQSVAINNTGSQPNASAILDISSTSKGLLIPRMTAVQRAAIANPVTGLQVYQTDGTKGFYYFNGSIWAQLGSAGANLTGWSTTGNAVINPATNFIGTTDTQAFIGKANNEQVFRFDAGSNNTIIGYQASHADSTGGTYNHIIGYKAGFNNAGSFNHLDGLQAGYNNGGNNNQFIGYNAGYTNTTGYSNLFVGSAAGYSNTIGAGNYLSGYQAGYKNTIGNVNQFVGYQAGFNNFSGTANYFSGFQAGFSNTTNNNNYFSGYKAGYNSKADFNHFEGNEAGYSNTTGTNNFFNGYNAGYSNITGSQNHFSGKQAGFSNISGSNNHFSGYEAGYSNLANDNHFEGNKAGSSNTAGTSNLFIGFGAGYLNTIGSNNTYIGKYAGFANTSSDQNVFVGSEAGYSNTGGLYNHFIGYRAGYTNSDGSFNHFDGYKAGALNTTGAYNNFVGNQAGYSNTTGGSNLAFGFKAGFSNTIGSNNIFHGLGSGFKNTSGSNNTYVGQSAGHENVAGSGNVALGNYAGYYETGNNKLYIANSGTTTPLIYGEFDNKLVKVFGSMEINTANYDVDIPTIRFTNRQYNGDWKIQAKAGPNEGGTYSFNELTFNTSQSDYNDPLFMLNGTGTLHTTGAMYASSDKRLKKNIVPLNKSLEKLLTLHGYTYNWIDSTRSPEQQIGVMAQEVEAVYPQLVCTGKRGFKSVAYANMVPVLLESIKEQQTMIDEIKTENIQLKKEIADIKAKLSIQ